MIQSNPPTATLARRQAVVPAWCAFTVAELPERPPDLVAEFGRFLDRFPWCWWVTLTFDPKRHLVGEAGALGAWAWWLKRIRKGLGHRVEFVLVLERHRSGLLHLHALVLNTDSLRYVPMSRAWQERYGFAQVETYNPGRGATGYLGKYLFKDNCSRPEFSRGLSRFAPAGQDSRVLDLVKTVFPQTELVRGHTWDLVKDSHAAAPELSAPSGSKVTE
jgi:hypothetical protein